MPLPKYKLTQDEVARAELLSLRMMLAVIMRQALDASPDPVAAKRGLELSLRSLAADLKLQAVPTPRQPLFRELVIARGLALVSQAESLEKRSLQ